MMEKENLEYLKKQLQQLGAGNTLDKSLEREMVAGKERFTLHLENKQASQQHGSAATLHFKKPDGGERYYFEKVHLELRDQKGEAVRDNTFFINHRQNNITLQEGINLLEGRAVNKDLISKEQKPYNAWVTLDLDKQQNAHGAYSQEKHYGKRSPDIEQQLQKMGVQELSDPVARGRVVTGLKAGNEVRVNVGVDKEQRSAVVEVSSDKGKLAVREKDLAVGQDMVKEYFGAKAPDIAVRMDRGKGL